MATSVIQSAPVSGFTTLSLALPLPQPTLPVENREEKTKYKISSEELAALPPADSVDIPYNPLNKFGNFAVSEIFFTSLHFDPTKIQSKTPDIGKARKILAEIFDTIGSKSVPGKKSLRPIKGSIYTFDTDANGLPCLYGLLRFDISNIKQSYKKNNKGVIKPTRHYLSVRDIQRKGHQLGQQSIRTIHTLEDLYSVMNYFCAYVGQHPDIPYVGSDFNTTIFDGLPTWEAKQTHFTSFPQLMESIHDVMNDRNGGIKSIDRL